MSLNIQFVDFESTTWRPTASEGNLSVDMPGIVLSRKAAADLGVRTGDQVKLTLPLRTGLGVFGIGATTVPVIAIHPHPLRFNAYMDIRHAGLAGLDNFANTVTGAPAKGKKLADVKRAMFGMPGVANVQGFAEASIAVRKAFEQISGVFWLVELFVLGLALLIAFNTANINSDERAREHATMFAFGVPVGRVIVNLAVEGVVLGIIATFLGVVLGLGLLTWMIVGLFPDSYPDMSVILSIHLYTNLPQVQAANGRDTGSRKAGNALVGALSVQNQNPSRIGRRTSFSPSCGPDPRKNWTAFLTVAKAEGAGMNRDGVVITVLS